jgi:hypothetical protein
MTTLQDVCWTGLQSAGCNCMLGVNIKFHGKVTMSIHAACDSCVFSSCVTTQEFGFLFIYAKLNVPQNLFSIMKLRKFLVW